MSTEKLIEVLADVEHERWSGWMRYLFTKGQMNGDGSFVIDADSVARWKRQAVTQYQDLSEQEKESDRAEVRKTLAVISQHNIDEAHRRNRIRGER